MLCLALDLWGEIGPNLPKLSTFYVLLARRRGRAQDIIRDMNELFSATRPHCHQEIINAHPSKNGV